MFVGLRRSFRIVLILGLAVTVATSAGCVGLTAQLLYWVNGGNKIDPEFEGMKEKRVAVVCVSNSGSYGPNSFCSLLERRVGMALREQGDKIDSNDWNQMDYREIGRGVNADMVLGIDVGDLRLHEGQTLYQGRATLTVTVYDMQDDGKVAFRRSIPDFTFPQNGPRHATEMTEARFRSLFVEVLAKQVAKYFCPYMFEEDFAKDATGLAG
jgi:hypothetical protein